VVEEMKEDPVKDPTFIVVPDVEHMDDYTRSRMNGVIDIFREVHSAEGEDAVEVIPRFRTEEEAETEMYIHYINRGFDPEVASCRAKKAAETIRQINEIEKKEREIEMKRKEMIEKLTRE